VPTYVKDNTNVRGLPAGRGSAAFVPKPAPRTGPFAAQLLSTGLAVLGKSRLPEFGFNASTEFMSAEPTRNPWHPRLLQRRLLRWRRGAGRGRRGADRARQRRRRVTRSVRDTATFFAAAERYWRNPALPPLGLVQGPPSADCASAC
jgi:amidase